MTAGLNILDIIFLIIVGISILLGIIKGFIRELFSLIFLIIGVVLAYLFYSDAAAVVLKFVNNKNIANFVGFTIIFTSILIVGAIFTYFIRKIFTVGPLKAVDRILGGVFGLLRGILILFVITLVLLAFPGKHDLFNKSKFSPYIINTAETVLNWLPDNVREKIKFIEKEKAEINKGRNHDRKKTY